MLTFALLAAFLPVPIVSAPVADTIGPAVTVSVPAREFVRIPAGTWVPFYGDGAAQEIEAFDLHRFPVSQQDYLRFITDNPQWQRDRIRGAFADDGYLRDWSAPHRPSDLAAPAVNVSWFAARAYCRSIDGRLPTNAEWEYVGAASMDARDASRDAAFRARLLDLYTRARPATLPAVGSGMRNWYGVADMHGFVREWVADFNNVMVSDDSRGTSGDDAQLYCAGAASKVRDPSDYAAFLRYALRASLTGRSTQSNVGFRCARSIS